MELKLPKFLFWRSLKNKFHTEKMPLSLTSSFIQHYLVLLTFEDTILNVKDTSEKKLDALSLALKKLTF